jgi:putative FmdB family regulatory protein
MPLYEFHCSKCETDFEALVPTSKWEGTAACPQCGSKKLSKQLSTFAPAVLSSSGPMPCDVGACPAPRQKRSGCGCCGGGAHRH